MTNILYITLRHMIERYCCGLPSHPAQFCPAPTTVPISLLLSTTVAPGSLSFLETPSTSSLVCHLDLRLPASTSFDHPIPLLHVKRGKGIPYLFTKLSFHLRMDSFSGSYSPTTPIIPAQDFLNSSATTGRAPLLAVDPFSLQGMPYCAV